MKEIKRKKVTTEDLKSMSEGEVKTFYVLTTFDIESARNMAYRLRRLYPELNIKYSSVADYNNKSITFRVISNK